MAKTDNRKNKRKCTTQMSAPMKIDGKERDRLNTDLMMLSVRINIYFIFRLPSPFYFLKFFDSLLKLNGKKSNKKVRYIKDQETNKHKSSPRESELKVGFRME